MKRLVLFGVKRLAWFCAAAGLLSSSLVMISGCGQKGALYLPPRNGTVVTRPAGSNAPQDQSAPAPQSPQDPNKKDNNDSSPRPK